MPEFEENVAPEIIIKISLDRARKRKKKKDDEDEEEKPIVHDRRRIVNDIIPSPSG
jgi:hypothetical protein